ncbi:MAG: hypothetical protein PHH85_07060 [Candidatus Methanoperedens sp.]|nr:hypothetical protein [Candidatus Methanoperedens sp.]
MTPKTIMDGIRQAGSGTHQASFERGEDSNRGCKMGIALSLYPSTSIA